MTKHFINAVTFAHIFVSSMRQELCTIGTRLLAIIFMSDPYPPESARWTAFVSDPYPPEGARWMALISDPYPPEKHVCVRCV